MPHAPYHDGARCVGRRQEAANHCDDREAREVRPEPLTCVVVTLLEDDELVDVTTPDIEDQPRAHAGNEDYDERVEGHLARPAQRRCFLEHVEESAEGRVERGREAGCAAHDATDALVSGEAVLVNDEGVLLEVFSVQFDPLSEVPPRHELREGHANAATDGHQRPFPSSGQARCSRKHRAHGPNPVLALAEKIGDRVAV
mmetsp:Transcript_31797/g.87844  ORF Transcript_31797/g.87844 Transcript_31797/m.87844 type:complete len:200 (+) Transcript_31797:1711-2310(+)